MDQSQNSEASRGGRDSRTDPTLTPPKLV